MNRVFRMTAVLSFFLLAAALFSGCGGKEAGEASGEKAFAVIKDDMGRDVTLPTKPERIVVLSASFLEPLHAVGGDVVGRPDSKTQMPDYAKDKASVGAVYQIDMEKVLACKPDLVIVNKGMNEKLVPTLEENNIPALVLDMKERDWYIATDTKMRERITDKAGQGHLSDKFLPALSQNRYAEAFGAYAATTDEMLTYYEKEGKPFDPKAGFSLLALGIAVVLAGVIFWLVRSSLMGSMSNVTAATEADAYLNQESFNLTENRDTFLYMNVTRREKPKKKETSSSRDESHGGGGGKF